MIQDNLNYYKEEFKKCINDLKNKKTAYKQIPNLITIIRPIGIIPANILFFTGHPMLAIILTGLLLSTDLIDGKLARKWNVQSKLGADLDAVGDKIMFLGMAIPITILNPIMLINILLEAVISYTNVLAKIKGLNPKTVYSGKVKTCFLSILLLTGYLTSFLGIAGNIFKLFIALTGISQSITLYDYIKKYNDEIKLKENNIKSPLENENLIKGPKESSTEFLVDQLKKEREFLLSIKDNNQTNIFKKRIKKISNKEKNNHHNS